MQKGASENGYAVSDFLAQKHGKLKTWWNMNVWICMPFSQDVVFQVRVFEGVSVQISWIQNCIYWSNSWNVALHAHFYVDFIQNMRCFKTLPFDGLTQRIFVMSLVWSCEIEVGNFRISKKVASVWYPQESVWLLSSSSRRIVSPCRDHSWISPTRCQSSLGSPDGHLVKTGCH